MIFQQVLQGVHLDDLIFWNINIDFGQKCVIDTTRMFFIHASIPLLTFYQHLTYYHDNQGPSDDLRCYVQSFGLVDIFGNQLTAHLVNLFELFGVGIVRMKDQKMLQQKQ